MALRLTSLLVCGAAALLSLAAHAQIVETSPLRTSVEGGQTKRFWIRFRTPPASVTFTNDACGTFGSAGFIAAVPVVDGIAAVDFTALPNAGITCTVTASTGFGGSVEFRVVTYKASQVSFVTSIRTTRNGPLLPGDPFWIEARAQLGSQILYDVDLTATTIPRTGSARVLPNAAHTDANGAVSFEVGPEAGSYDIDLSLGSATKRFALDFPALELPYQGLWWAGSLENGWGMSVVQHGDRLFNVIYAYDAAGRPTWYVMPGGTWNAARTTFSGPVFTPQGSAFPAYDATRFVAGAPVGDATITFNSRYDAVLDYTIDGLSGRKTITPQVLGLPVASTTTKVADMWWGGAAQNGWGIAMLQQFAGVFGIWFHYDDTGRATWATLPGVTWTTATQADGKFYRTTGSPWAGRPYDVTALRVTEAGTFRLRFSGDSATFDYTLDGRTGSLPLSRQPF